ncbi:MAG TPA: HEAT repeat domain-containing protein [Terriglobales bacterium]|nr:HEAT repeat domain-containing protein [Terriglobales bacterium]
MRMAMLHFSVVAVLVTVILGDSTCIAQAPPTIQAELRKYGVPVTQLALQSALKDNRPEIRGLAAAELAEMKDVTSVPLIVKALEAEKDQLVKFNMATALVSLNSPAGTKALLHTCDDASVPAGRRLDAASRLVDAGDLSCLPSVENILRKTTDPSNKVSALLLLARVKVVPASLVPRIHDTLLASLQDPDSAVRGYTSQCIAALGDKAAAPSLKTAIANESDESTRERMEESQKSLESRP